MADPSGAALRLRALRAIPSPGNPDVTLRQSGEHFWAPPDEAEAHIAAGDAEEAPEDGSV